MSENPNESPWKNPAIWGRVVFVVLFLLIFALIVGPLAIVLGLVQALFTIFTGEDNRNLRDLAAALGEYIHEILLFASWNREQKPFPFSEFPSFPDEEGSTAEADDADTESVEVEDEAKEESAEEAAPDAEAPAKKTTRRKSPRKKAAADETED